jgi:hypothetical protein
MTQDEIIEMARQAGLDIDSWEPLYEGGLTGFGVYECTHEELERFAKLVAQHEREACAYWAGIALLGADRGLSNRVDQAIRARGQA